MDAATLSLSKPVYTPTAKEIDEAVADLAKQNRTYEPRTGKTVKAKDGDQVVIDFVGRVDGEAFEGGTATDVELVLGSGQFIPGFEEQLLGAKPDSDVMVKVTFPENYQAANLAGKSAEFETKVKEVRGPVDSPADDAFAERLGIENLDKLKELVKGNLEEQYAGASRFKLKRALLDVLDTKHDFPLPPKMLEAEFATIWSQVQKDKESGELPEDDAKKTDKQLEKEYRKIAERRVRLGLVLAEIGRANNVQVTDAEVNDAMLTEARRYGAQAQQVYDLFRQNPNAQAQLRAPIFEDKVVDLIVEKAKVKDQKVTKDDLLRQNQNAQAQLRAPIFEDKVVDLIVGKAKVADQKVSKEELLREDDLPEGYAGDEAPKPKKKAAPKKAAAKKAAAKED